MQYSAKMCTEIAQQMLTAQPPSCSTAIALDIKVRRCPTPPEQIMVEGAEYLLQHYNRTIRDVRTSLVIRPLQIITDSYICFAVVLLFIHRAFFMQTLIDNPQDPKNSQYWISFDTAYSCAQSITRATRDCFARAPSLTVYAWNVWTSTFASAVSDALSCLSGGS
jgi:hypothetical protein